MNATSTIEVVEKPLTSFMPNPQQLESIAVNMAKVTQQSSELLQEFMQREPKSEGNLVASSLESAVNAFQEMMLEWMKHPEDVMLAMHDLWQDYLTLWANTTARVLGSQIPPAYIPAAKDKRFKDEAWSRSIIFDFIKQSYLLTSQWLEERLQSPEAQMLGKHRVKQLEFYTRQYLNALSPANFAFTNPQVIEEMIATNGESLVRGLNNVLKDLRENEHQFQVGTTVQDAFEIGKNIAVTPGKVVFRNRLMELIQYTPTTSEVYKTPLLIISPWINKYYILDMRLENSFVKWAVGQGHTVFIVSWVNPSRELANVNFEDYMKEGSLAALDVIEKITGEKQTNVIGYCLGGTLLTATLSWLINHNQQNRVKCATFFTTLIDFSEPGDMGVFIDEEQIAALEEELPKKGFYDGRDMAFIFSMLRSNEMIWSFAVNNYLLGKDRLPFDLLYWNADSTSLPAPMHLYYLRNMYLNNDFCKPNALTLLGNKIDVTKIDTPCYFVSTREDHIAPWRSTYAATQLFKGKLKFVLSASGHIAGIINPPGSKYGYWTNETFTQAGAYPDADGWLKDAKEYQSSWWQDWQNWLVSEGYIRGKVPARKEGSAAFPALADAPGEYVKVKLGAPVTKVS